MFVSQTVLGYLDQADAEYDLLTHPHTTTALDAARSAQVPYRQLAKGVLFHDDDDLVLAVVPAWSRVNAWAVAEIVDSPYLQLVDEQELSFVFRDCERGAVPALGAPFGVRSVIHEELLHSPSVYFEAGDHERLVHMRGEHFARLVRKELHGYIAC